METKTRSRSRLIKPLNGLSDTTSSDLATVIEILRVARRGRKPIDACSTTSAPLTAASTISLSSGKKTKRQKMLEEAAEEKKAVVCFGNQVVAKGTPEYDGMREKNREAVKKFREKKDKERLEREEKIPELHKENDTLKTKLDAIVKEINVVKDNIMKVKRGSDLPDDILKLFQQFENECKDVGI
jgi:hypothetical protein